MHLKKRNLKLLENTAQYRKTPKGVLTNMYNHMKTRHATKFTLLEFHQLFLADRRFLRLFKEWEKSGYQKQFKPSLDRIDYKNGYEVGNIQMLSWAENHYKQRMELKRVRARKVYQIFGAKVVRVFNSQREAVLATGLNQGLMSMVLNGVRKHTGGYKWSYENPELVKT